MADRDDCRGSGGQPDEEQRENDGPSFVNPQNLITTPKDDGQDQIAGRRRVRRSIPWHLDRCSKVLTREATELRTRQSRLSKAWRHGSRGLSTWMQSIQPDGRVFKLLSRVKACRRKQGRCKRAKVNNVPRQPLHSAAKRDDSARERMVTKGQRSQARNRSREREADCRRAARNVTRYPVHFLQN